MVGAWTQSKGLVRALLVGGVASSVMVYGLPAATVASASAVPTTVAFSVQPVGGVAAATDLGTAPKVHVTDTDGNDVEGVSVSMALQVVFPAGQLNNPPALTCPSADTDSNGVAEFTSCKVSRAGRYRLVATAGSVTSDPSSSFDITGLSQLAFTVAPPASSGAGAVWDPQPQVTMRNTDGTTHSATASIGLIVQPSGGGAFYAMPCTNNPVAAVGGVADFTGCRVATAGTGYKLYAVDTADSLLGAPSSLFDIAAGAAAQLIFTQQPAGAPGGASLASQPIVTAADAGGNPVSGYNQVVHLAVTPGTGTAGAAVTCDSNAPQATNGVATFTGCAIDKAGTGYSLRATVTQGSLSADSQPLAITAGSASVLTFATQPDNAHGGSAFGTQPVVHVRDSGNNVANGVVTLSFTPGTNTEGAHLSCPANPISSSAGTASFAGCAIDTDGSYQLRATANGHSVDSDVLTVSEGAASQVTFTATPAGGTGGSAFAPQPIVDVLDSGGNPASGSAHLTLDPLSGTPGATLTCASSTVAADSAGHATFSGCKIDKAGLGYRLKATLSADSAVKTTSQAFDIGVGLPAQLAFTTQPGGGAGGEAWAQQPVVTVEDAGGNLVSTATTDVTLTRTANNGTGTLTCKDTTLPTQKGVARFDGCSIDDAGSGYTLEASAAIGGTTTSAVFDITVGAPARLVFATQPGGAAAGSLFSAQPVVRIVDRGNNTVTGAGSAIALAITSGTGTPGAFLSCSSRSASSGVAAFSTCAINQAGGGYALTATDTTDHLTAESRGFSVLLPPPAPLEQVPATPLPLGQTFGGSVYGDNPTSTTHDVNSATGALSFASTDLRVAGLGVPFVAERTYSSADATGGAFGRGWSSLFDISVVVVPNSTMTLRGEDGQRLVWTWDAVYHRWNAPVGSHVQMTCGAKSCRVIRDDNTRFEVNLTANGQRQLDEYEAPDGQGLKLAWSSASGPGTVKVTLAGAATATITATLNADGEITQIATPTRTVRYGYNASKLLTSATDALGVSHTWTYGYDAAGRLTTVTDPTPKARLIADYDAATGRVSRLRVLGSERRSDDTYTYSGAGNVLTTTRHALQVVGTASAARQDYVDRYKNGILVSQALPSGGTTRFSYDAAMHLVESQDALGWTSTYTYDQSGNLTSQTVPVSSTRAATVRMGYDGQHRITWQTDANGNTTTYSYAGPWLSAVKPPANGNVQWTRFDYDGVGHLVDTVGPTNRRVFTYDARGNMLSVKIQDLWGKAQNGNGTTFTYDEAGDRTSTTDPLGHKTTSTFDAAGQQTQTTPALGAPTSYAFDVAGDLVSTIDPAGHSTSWTWDDAAGTRTTRVGGTPTLVQTYDPAGSLLSEDPAGAADHGTSYTYDSSARQQSKTDAAGITTHYGYDLNNNVMTADDTAGQALTQQFDALGRLIRRTDNGRTASSRYDLVGNIVSSTDAAGNTTTFGYNADELVSSAQNAAGTTRYGYDTAGNLVTVIDPGGHTTSYAYDPIGRKTRTTAGGGSTTSTYDADNNLTSTTDPNGRKTSYALDALHRVTATTYTPAGSGYTVTQGYDALGRRSFMNDPTGNHSYGYDTNGNLSSVSTAANGHTDTFHYDWTTDPGKIHETYPDGTAITYSLDDRQKLMNVSAGTKGTDDYAAASYLRNAQRQTTGIAFSNGVLETRQLNASGDVLRQQLTVAGKPAADDAFTYDAQGNPLSQVNSVNGTVTTSRFGYDGAGRLNAQSHSAPAPGGIGWPAVTGLSSANDSSASQASATYAPSIQTPAPVAPSGPAPAQSIRYDADGNRVSITTPAGTTTSALNASDQVASQAGAQAGSYTYDASGNMLSSTRGGQQTTYGYDSAGRLVRVTPPSGGPVTYTYDGDGNRVTRTTGGVTTEMLWDPANDQPQLALERRASDRVVLRRYLYGEGPVAMQVPSGASTATYFYHLDPHGNVTELTNSDGSLAAVYHYDGFGNVTVEGSGHGNPLMFQAEYLDPSSQLYYMKARNYDATTGRFTQRDPKAPNIGAPVMTPYAFANDRPTGLADPKGTSTETDAVFWSHTSDEANIGSDTKLATSAVAVGIKGGMKLSSLLSTKAVTAVDSLATSVGSEARAASVAVREAGAGGESLAAAGKEAGAAGEALGGAAKVAKFAGAGLAIAGVGLQAFITVEDCLHDTAFVCAADTVGLAISVGFLVGCEFVSAGAATIACALIGGALAIAIPELITKFGPQAVAGIIAGYNIVAGAVEAAIPIVAEAINTAIDAVTTFAEDAGGAIVAGFNSGVAAVTSGFWSAVDALRDAGYSAAQLATTLVNAFAEGVQAAISTLVDFGYQIGDVALALRDALAKTAAQAAVFLKEAFNTAVVGVATALKEVYALAAQGLAEVMKAANYAIDEVVTGLKTLYADLSAATDAAYQALITALDAVNYGINQIAGALQDVYHAVDQAVTLALHEVAAAIGYTVEQVAAVLQTVFDDTAQAAMAAFHFATYLAEEAAQALTQVFDVVAAEAAHLLDLATYALNEIAGALQTVFNQLDTEVAQIFETLGKTATDVVNALVSAYGALVETAAYLAGVLHDVGYLATQAMHALEDVFTTAAADVAAFFNTVGYALNDIVDAIHDVFAALSPANVIAILTSFSSAVNSIALAIADTFVRTATEVAQAFQSLGYDIVQLTNILKDAFGTAAEAVASILKDGLGYAAAAIAGVLQGIYQLGSDIVAGLLSAAGFLSDAISAIGGAFASFGQSIADAASDAWDAITSIF